MHNIDSVIEMARRHVVEREARLVRQEALVHKLATFACAESLQLARDLLRHMQTTQDAALEHVRRLEGEREGKARYRAVRR